MDDDVLYRVRATTDAKDLGNKIAYTVRDGKTIILRAIGAQAVHQAVKAGAIARGLLAANGRDLYLAPGFQDVPMPDGVTTANVLRVVVH